MKYIFVILLAISPITDLDKIAKVNEIKKEAKEAYNNGNYEKAIKQYTYLLDSMEIEDESITLNLANAYYQLKDSVSLVNAAKNYEVLTSASDGTIKSVAHQQLGIMADRSKKFEEALGHFKDAIRANPKNDEARYNYELLKKMLEKQKKKNQQNKKDQQNKDQQKQDQQKQDQQNKDQKNKDQQKQDQKNKDGKDKGQKDQQKQDQQNKEGEKKDEQKKQDQQQDGKKGDEKKDQQQKPQEGDEADKKKGDEEQMKNLSDKLKKMNISKEKAKMILEAMKNNEIQYIQQNKKKATKRNDPNKPDW